jgi:hypothetical protein
VGREALMKGKLSTVNLLLLASFDLQLFYVENNIYLLSKTRYLTEEVNGTEPNPSVSVP